MEKVNALEEKEFIETSVSLLMKCSFYLLNNLPLENQAIASAYSRHGGHGCATYGKNSWQFVFLNPLNRCLFNHFYLK